VSRSSSKPALADSTAINPVNTFDYPCNLGRALYAAGRYEEAVESLRKAIEANEAALILHLFLAASFVRPGRKEDVERGIEQVRIIDPDYSDSRYRSMSRIANNEELNRFLDY
jgi:tetratricopeptide (TPR) repeat protein